MMVPVIVDRRVEQYIRAIEHEENRPAEKIVTDLVYTGYVAYVKELHRRYLGGEFSLRGMAKRLGLSYRAVYAILEELGLPLTGAVEKAVEGK